MNNLKINKMLFLTFLKIGAFTFGGGYAMIPLIQKELVEKKKWISDQDILDVVAIAESTPGPIAVNSATFVGYKVNGFWGAFFSTFGVVLPSFLVILAVSVILRQFQSNLIVKYAFNGIRAGVLALLIRALISLYQTCPKKILSYGIWTAAFLMVAIFKVSAFIIIILSAILGILAALFTSERSKR